MDPHNLATCLAPTMIRSDDLMTDAMMCQLPRSSATIGSKRNSIGPLKENEKEFTSFASVFMFMIACFPLLFELNQSPSQSSSTAPISSSCPSNDSASDDLSLFEFIPSMVTTDHTEGQDAEEDRRDPRSRLSNRRIARFPSPIRGCVSQVGLSHSYSPCRNPKSLDPVLHKFSTLQVPQEYTKPDCDSLGPSFLPESLDLLTSIVDHHRPIAPPASSSSGRPSFSLFPSTLNSPSIPKFLNSNPFDPILPITYHSPFKSQNRPRDDHRLSPGPDSNQSHLNDLD